MTALRATARLAGILATVTALAVAAFLVAPLTVTAAVPLPAEQPEIRNTPAPYRMPEGYVHWVGELESGSDLEHYAAWILAEVDAEEDRPRPDGYLFTELDMIWLYLTPEEAEKANGLIGQSPLVSGEATSVVSLPTPVPNGGPYAAPGKLGRQLVPVGIERIGTPVDEWQYAPSPGRVRVGVLDTGIDSRHPDLALAGGYNCSQDHRGPEGYGIDEHSHGSHVAGTIGAKHDDAYVVGVAPGVALYSEAVFSASGSASGAMVLCGLNKALEHGVDIISASLGGSHVATRCPGPSSYSNGWCRAARKAVVVVAAGNDATDAIHFGPANTDSPGVVTVGAIVDFDGLPGGEGLGYPGCGFTHLDDALAAFSNTGRVVDAVAPGGCVLSTAPGSTLSWMSGTSMSTPAAAGAFAAFMAKFPECRDPAEVVKVVLKYARDYAKAHPDEGYTGWPAADAPPLIRWVDEEPLLVQDPENPTPCAFQSDVRS